jgi:hypothetical protein
MGETDNATQILTRLLDSYQRYQDAQCKVALLSGLPFSGKSLLARRFTETVQGRYIDHLDEQMDRLHKPLGVYGPVDLLDDVKSWTRDITTALVIDEIEPLLVTWRDTQRGLFIRQVTRLRTSCFVLLVLKGLGTMVRDAANQDLVFEVSYKEEIL